jgi:hypothetical protein
VVRTPVFSTAEARQIAGGHFNVRALSFIQGEAEVIGTPNLVAGDLVVLENLGVRFSGTYYLTSVTHAVNQKGFTTRVTVQRTAT